MNGIIRSSVPVESGLHVLAISRGALFKPLCAATVRGQLLIRQLRWGFIYRKNGRSRLYVRQDYSSLAVPRAICMDDR
jgi:hypothetical protein